jgi:hypothetical protein
MRLGVVTGRECRHLRTHLVGEKPVHVGHKLAELGIREAKWDEKLRRRERRDRRMREMCVRDTGQAMANNCTLHTPPALVAETRTWQPEPGALAAAAAPPLAAAVGRQAAVPRAALVAPARLPAAGFSARGSAPSAAPPPVAARPASPGRIRWILGGGMSLTTQGQHALWAGMPGPGVLGPMDWRRGCDRPLPC